MKTEHVEKKSHVWFAQSSRDTVMPEPARDLSTVKIENRYQGAGLVMGLLDPRRLHRCRHDHLGVWAEAGPRTLIRASMAAGHSGL